MTKEEQRFTAAVAAMNGLLANIEANTDWIKSINNDERVVSASIYMADALMEELDKKVDYKEIPERPYVEDLLDSHIKKNEPLPPYEVADTVVTKANPDAIVVTKTQITTQNRNSIRTTPDPITEPSMNAIGDIKLRK